jgi:hypothetical protein
LMQDRCTVCANIQQAQKLFWTHMMEHLGDVGDAKSHFGPFGDSASIIAPLAPNVP